jgi:hypothetical protein
MPQERAKWRTNKATRKRGRQKMKRFKGKVAAITGGNSGIGLATARNGETRVPVKPLGFVEPSAGSPTQRGVQRRCMMKRLMLLAAVAVIVLTGADAAIATELPTYELTGFPISAHQASVVGSAHVQEASPVATLTLGGMPASTLQIAVLTPRKNRIGDLVENPTPTSAGREVKR